jgi:hypothetical protein
MCVNASEKRYSSSLVWYASDLNKYRLGFHSTFKIISLLNSGLCFSCLGRLSDGDLEF